MARGGVLGYIWCPHRKGGRYHQTPGWSPGPQAGELGREGGLNGKEVLRGPQLLPIGATAFHTPQTVHPQDPNGTAGRPSDLSLRPGLNPSRRRK